MNTMFVLSKSTPLSDIISVVRDDFDVDIDMKTAKKIRDAYRDGCLVWTAYHLKTTDGSQINITREPII